MQPISYARQQFPPEVIRAFDNCGSALRLRKVDDETAADLADDVGHDLGFHVEMGVAIPEAAHEIGAGFGALDVHQDFPLPRAQRRQGTEVPWRRDNIRYRWYPYIATEKRFAENRRGTDCFELTRRLDIAPTRQPRSQAHNS